MILLGIPTKPITPDDVDRIMTCVRVLADQNATISTVFTNNCREALASMLQEQADFEATHSKSKKKKHVAVQPDDPIPFLQLMSKNDMVNGEDVFELSLSQAIGFNPRKDDTDVRNLTSGFDLFCGRVKLRLCTS